MNPELKAKWVAALRSGEYKQAHETLRAGDDAFCCLGVLLQISGAGRWDNETEYYFVDEDGEEHCAEGDLCRYRVICGISITQQGRLVAMNDSDRNTFPEIADWIEKNL